MSFVRVCATQQQLTEAISAQNFSHRYSLLQTVHRVKWRTKAPRVNIYAAQQQQQPPPSLPHALHSYASVQMYNQNMIKIAHTFAHFH